MSVFENRESAEQSNQVAAQWVRTIGGLLLGPPEITSGEIVIHAEREQTARIAA